VKPIFLAPPAPGVAVRGRERREEISSGEQCLYSENAEGAGASESAPNGPLLTVKPSGKCLLYEWKSRGHSTSSMDS